MRRRHFLFTGTALLLAPFAAWGQAKAVPRIAFLGYGPATGFTRHFAAMRQGFEQFGYVEGKNLLIEYRFGEDDERVTRLAEEVVRMDPRIIVTSPGFCTRAVAKLTQRIPIVQATGASPVDMGLAVSHARPGGNVTGLGQRPEEGVAGKLVELVKALAPKTATIGVLISPASPLRERYLSDARAAGQVLGLTTVPLVLGTAAEVERMPWRKPPCDALAVLPDLFLYWYRRRLVELIGRIPTIYPFREFVEDGGVASYGPNLLEHYGRVASFVDRLLKGAKAGDIPIELSSRFEVVVNRKVAKALGIAIPPQLLVRADELID